MAYCMVIDVGGTRVIARMSGKRPKVCAFCKKKYSTKLCDAKVDSGTCNAPMCDDCSIPGGKDIDFCRFHRPKQVQETLFK